MKKELILALAMVCGGVMYAQAPPAQVSKMFSQKFASAEKVKWDQEEENEWEAEFKMNGKEMSASFDNAGKWLETETSASKADLPTVVIKAVQEKYSGWKMEEVECVEKPDFKGYEIELEKGTKEMEILVAETGKITVKKETKESGEKEEKEDSE